ncbi:hypothetical protein METBIDRAFT_213813 [Metschnikowia bicuspidata var. bicuspidata NRRL YB-4993]|uniref:Uncharacterized protein n=1 Tax=Metschnikowia bicuspidata var. bicuspidata NRRL YB-4993 TaxID=869754 RepID=A0A1A0H8F2_9ASCO|nr:hypothetical protein METBIDRAFT_213813 [Metschnikowia bicuspidata var. bicuspidata NRRL YB-4993]OBA20168.1 hypothetical protein METBIDRAFT_213813 [Metschnikowia bicuspidata var. bicuspidata NRRL YB-4993]
MTAGYPLGHDFWCQFWWPVRKFFGLALVSSGVCFILWLLFGWFLGQFLVSRGEPLWWPFRSLERVPGPLSLRSCAVLILSLGSLSPCAFYPIPPLLYSLFSLFPVFSPCSFFPFRVLFFFL